MIIDTLKCKKIPVCMAYSIKDHCFRYKDAPEIPDPRDGIRRV